jgi:hypothetical protein
LQHHELDACGTLFSGGHWIVDLGQQIEPIPDFQEFLFYPSSTMRMNVTFCTAEMAIPGLTHIKERLASSS